MMRCQALSILTLFICSTAAADPVDEAKGDKRASDPDQLVLLNATTRLMQGPVTKIKRVFDARGMLHELPDGLEAILDGRNLQVSNIDAIRTAYTNLEYDAALKLIDDNEARILQFAGGGDPLPALTELSMWRGLIATGQDRPDEAVEHFRTALRFNPTWALDKRLAAPSVNRLVKKAKKATNAIGRLRVEVEPETALIQIDGGKPQAAGDKLTLDAGFHLVVVSAEGRATYAELVEIENGKTTKLPVALDPESTSDRAAKLVDATVAAPPGAARLKKAKKLSPVAGTKVFVIVEDSGAEHLTLRVYDTGAKKVSKPVEVDINASSQAIASKVLAALDPDNMIEPGQVPIMLVKDGHRQRWYERWYVWVGVAALAGGGALGYHYMTREPTEVRGF
jgi:hypothetical protein